MTSSCCVVTAVILNSVTLSLSSVCVKETFLNGVGVWTNAVLCHNIVCLTVRSYSSLRCDAPTLVPRKRQKRLHITSLCLSFFSLKLSTVTVEHRTISAQMIRLSVFGFVPRTCWMSGSWYRCRSPDIPGRDGHFYAIGIMAVTLHLASLLKRFRMTSAGKSW